MSAKKNSKNYEVTKRYTERQILSSKTPEEYIDRTLNSGLSRGQKTILCRQWREHTGFSIEEVQYARNRHPYWKQKKMNGWRERNERRWAEHDYAVKKKSSQPFSEKQIQLFLELNKKDKKGAYQLRDWQIAKEMNVTIPAVQHWRRKLLLVLRLLETEDRKPTRKIILEYLCNHENGLRRRIRELSAATGKATSRSSRKAANA